MRKTRMISVIAASMLTATVVFTGCGGGGSSTSTATSSSSSEASSSSVPQATLKKVIVSDGYVLQATVKCKDAQGNDVAGPATATNNPGEYELSLTSACPVLCAKDGYIDVNANGQLDDGEPKAPKMTAPGSYTNINPYTTLIQNGLSVAKVRSAFNLPEDTNLDVAIPEAPAAVRMKAIELSVFLSYLQSKQAATTKACLPGTPCNEGNEESTESSASGTSDVVTLEDFIAALNAGKSFNELIPEDLQPIINEVENADSAEEAEHKAAVFLATTNGCYGECGSSSSEATSSSVESSSSSTTSSSSESTSSSEESSSSEECLPGTSCGNSSSATTSSVESSEATSSSECTPIYPGDCQSSSEESSSSEATSSSEESSSSEATSSSECTPIYPGDCQSSSEESSSSEATSSSEESSSSEATSSSECTPIYPGDCQ